MKHHKYDKSWRDIVIIAVFTFVATACTILS